MPPRLAAGLFLAAADIDTPRRRRCHFSLIQAILLSPGLFHFRFLRRRFSFAIFTPEAFRLLAPYYAIALRFLLSFR
jgi:hypothetical protein